MAGAFFCISASGAEPSLVTLANLLQGTDDPTNFSHGNIFPAIALPFPMNVWAPYTERKIISCFINIDTTRSAACARRMSRAGGSAITPIFR